MARGRSSLALGAVCVVLAGGCAGTGGGAEKTAEPSAQEITAGAATGVKTAKLSEATEECLGCHEEATPGIVADWRRSRHAHTTPAAALGEPEAGRRISATEVPPELAGVAVGCAECHKLNPDGHPDTFDHFDHDVHVVVSPPDCRTCHPTEVKQFAGTKKAHAVGNLAKNPVYTALVESALGTVGLDGKTLTRGPSSAHTRGQACYGCHGTEVKVEGTRTVESDYGEYEAPLLSGWPNQGVGRVNPDGSMGACTACHSRHGFSIALARQPNTCRQCHLEPDLPAFNVYMESKHGNIWATEGGDRTWHWDTVPWVVGRDFVAPTCATCHSAGLVGPDGGTIAERTHDFGARLWVRIFGLTHAHPQPKSGDTSTIRNADGLPLPTTFEGALASEHLIDEAEQGARLGKMRRVCLGCHGSSWADGHFAGLETAIEETNEATTVASELMKAIWDSGEADPTNPFDEGDEQTWVKSWLFYANSIRYAAAMSGPDYASFKNGWWQMAEALEALEQSAAGGKTKRKKRTRRK